MKRILQLAAKLYPKSWRGRYGEEFEALLEDVGWDRRVLLNVIRGATLMQIKHRKMFLAAAGITSAVLWELYRWSERTQYTTPGTHQIFRMDSTFGAMLEFVALIAIVGTAIITLMDGRKRWLSPSIAAAYLSAAMLVALLTPQKIISVGDSYCWDLWCIGIQNVQQEVNGENMLYRAEVSLSVDSTTAELPLNSQPSKFFYVIDERGRKFPIRSFSPVGEQRNVVKPAQPVRGAITFVAPADVQSIFLTGDLNAPLWVRLYFAGDLGFFHRRTLLRIA